MSLAVFFNLNIKNIHAESGMCNATLDMGTDDGGNPLTKNLIHDKTTSSKEECTKLCEEEKSKLSDSQKQYWKDDTCQFKSDSEQKKEDEEKRDRIGKAAGVNAGVCGNMNIFSVLEVFKCLLLYILYFAKLLLNIAFNLFKWTIDVDSLNKVMGSSVIYQIWKIVRDMFNIIFIMTLLFSAFATVLQIEKYNYKRILLNLVIMALLVNFSFPITRFIIDISNVIMYFFVNTLLNGGSGADDLLSSSALGTMLSSISVKDSLLFLIAAIVFVFIFAITILVLAVLLLIRTIALSILIIFSPIAYVGSIIPGTSLAKTASDWWSKLMEYAFFGPTMVFLVYIAAKMMTIVPKDEFDKIASVNNTDSQTAAFIAAATFYVIPLAILWMGMMSAKRGSIEGSSIIVGYGQKAAGWGGRKVRTVITSPYTGSKSAAKGIWKRSGIPGGFKQRYEQWKKDGFTGTERTAQREAAFASALGTRGAMEKDMKRRAEEFKKSNAQTDELKVLAAGGDAAAAYRLAEDKDMDQATYNSFISKNKNSDLAKSVNSKVKQNRMDIVAHYNAEAKVSKMTSGDIQKVRNDAVAAGNARAAGWSDDMVRNRVKAESMREDIGKLSPDKFAEQDWGEILKGPMTTEKKLTLIATYKALSRMKDPGQMAKKLNPNQRGTLISELRSYYGNAVVNNLGI